MVGCCGQRGNNQNHQRDNKEKCAPIDTNMGNNKCVPGANTGNNRGKYVTGQHDEEVCHGTGERRRDLLDQLKIFLNEFDDKPCMVAPPQQGPNALRTLGSYPEYLKKHCQSWMPPNPKPPLITSVQTHEIRATSDYDKMKGETSEYVSFRDATLKPPPSTCECVKRNGLQDQCPHPMCKPPTAQCKANNPGPCCPPSLGLGGPEAVLGGSKQGGAAGAAGTQGSQKQEPPPRSEYQEAFMYRQPGNQNIQEQAPPPSYTTTYHQDFQNQHGYQQPQMAMGPGQFKPQPTTSPAQQRPMIAFQQPLGAGVPHPPPGMEMMCICKATSSALPSGKKYLCCPVRL